MRYLARMWGGAPRRVALAIALVAALVLLPALVAGGLGRLVADLWVSTFTLVTGLLGGFFGH